MDIYSLAINIAAPRVGRVANVLHFSSDADASHNVFDVASILCSEWHDNSKAGLIAVLASDCVLESVSARRVSTGGGPTFTLPENTNGAAPNGPMGESALAAVVSWVPEVAPWQYGHIFIGPTPDGFITGNVWDNDYRINCDTYANTMKMGYASPVPVINFGLVIYDRKTGIGRPVHSLEFKDKPASLSRRLKPYS